MNTLTPISYADMPDPAAMQRTPNRPAGAFSDFVCTTMPDLCLHIEHGDVDPQSLSSTVENILNDTDVDLESMDREAATLSFLDCGMVEAAIGRFKLPLPGKLQSLTEALGTRLEQMPGLRYEPLIRANPLSTDPRLFSLQHGKGELLFYDIHRRIENIAVGAIRTMQSVLSALSSQPRESIADEIKSVTTANVAIRNEIQVLIDELPLEDFVGIRAYFNNACRKTVGPSGKDSAGIFVMDALAVGDDPVMRKFMDHKMDTVGFYPSSTMAEHAFAGQGDMRDALEAATEKQTLVTLGKPFAFLAPAIAEFVGSMHAVRAKHMALAKHFLPDAFKPDAPIFEGTGGVGDFPSYLKIPIGILNRMKQQ